MKKSRMTVGCGRTCNSAQAPIPAGRASRVIPRIVSQQSPVLDSDGFYTSLLRFL